MKSFGIILGNPAYNYYDSKTGKVLGGTRQLWRDATKWCFDLCDEGGIVGLVTPNNWTQTDYDSYLKVHPNPDSPDLHHKRADKLNPVAMKNVVKVSGIVKFEGEHTAFIVANYWIATNEPYKGITDYDGYPCDIRDLPYYPFKGEHIPIFEKIFSKTKEYFSFSQRGNADINKQKDEPIVGGYKNYFGPDTVRYSHEPCLHHDQKKIVLANNTAAWTPWYDDGDEKNGISGSSDIRFILAHEVPNPVDLDPSDSETPKIKLLRLLKYLESNVVRFIFKTTQRRQQKTLNIVRKIPAIPLDLINAENSVDEVNQIVYNYFELENYKEHIEKELRR